MNSRLGFKLPFHQKGRDLIDSTLARSLFSRTQDQFLQIFRQNWFEEFLFGVTCFEQSAWI